MEFLQVEELEQFTLVNQIQVIMQKVDLEVADEEEHLRLNLAAENLGSQL